MLKQYSVLLCVVVSVAFFLVAGLRYPGGSIQDANSIGFDWSKNFISNLFSARAINGVENPSRLWALLGIAFHSVGYGIFFIHTSKKMPHRHAATVLHYIGVFYLLLNGLIASPLHDLMVILSGTLSTLGLFYMTVFIFKSQRHWLKIGCILCLLTVYSTFYLYGAGNWGLLAILQKVSLVSSMALILAIEYSTEGKDFQPIQPSRLKTPATNR